MEKSEFYISVAGKQEGPYSLHKIGDLLATSHCTPLDYIFDPESDDWVLMMNYSPLKEAVGKSKPKSPPKPTGPKQSPQPESTDDNVVLMSEGKKKIDNHEWYILKGENKFGPFAYTDVIKMLQKGVVFEFDFAWHKGMDGWQRVADLSQFQHGEVKKLKDTLMPEISEVFFRRRHRRVVFGSTILIHDNKNVWKGKAVEISAGGAGVVMENAMVVPGQKLFMHFKPGDGCPPFNAICEVVSKKYVGEVKNKDQEVHYGLKFESISEEAQSFLQEYTKSAKSA